MDVSSAAGLNANPQQSNVLGQYMSAREVAETLSVTPKVVKLWINSGRLPIRIIRPSPTLLRLNRADFEEWLAKQEQSAAPLPLPIKRNKHGRR